MLSRERQRDHSVSITSQQYRKWGVALHSIARRQLLGSRCETAAMRAVFVCVKNYSAQRHELRRYLARSNRISLSDFTLNFNGLTDACCLSLFRFTKADISLMTTAEGWDLVITKRNQYACNPLLVKCDIPRRLTIPSRWRDMELLFGRHGSQLNDIFWEGIEQMSETRMDLITEPIDSSLLSYRAPIYARAVEEKCHALPICIGFIDETVIAIARPSGYEVQRVAYNGHKRKHALKFQAITAPDGLLLHAAGPIEGRRHDWTLHCRSGLDEDLEEIMLVDGLQYCLYGDSGYNERNVLVVPFQGSQLTGYQKSFNEAMAKGRVSVEWLFKEVKLYWSAMDYRRKMRTSESPVGVLYLAAMLLTNFRNYIYSNTISKYFLCKPPSFEWYLTHKNYSM